MKDLESKIRATLANQFGLSDEWRDGTYLYHLTRVKEAFGLGTMSLDDFKEVDEEFLEETVQAVIDTVKRHSGISEKNKFKNMTDEIWKETNEQVAKIHPSPRLTEDSFE